MKKITFILFFAIQISLAQVGIGTIAPEQDLHIAGDTATIRIERLNAINNSTYNDGIKLAPAFVDGNGDITLGNGTGSSGNSPLNFLIEIFDFIPDDPYGLGGRTGTVINNTGTPEQTVAIDTITTVTFTVPQKAIVEIKYGMTMRISGTNLKLGSSTYVDYNKAISMVTFIRVDVGNDGTLSAEENSKIYGIKSQYYATDWGGIVGFPYMNGQAYLTLPEGTHTLYFFGIVSDAATSYTSVGFGGAQDYLKIRVYN